MDLFILDSQMRRTALLDQYTSLIWTERYSSAGEFELIIPSTGLSRSLLTQGTHLAINESARIMTIESVEDKTADDGTALLDVKGPSLEDILSDRVARNLAITNPNNDPTDLAWYFVNQLPADLIRQIFQYVVIDHNIDPGDAIPFYTVGNIYPADTIAEPDTEVSLSVSPSDLYSAIQQLCEIYDLGFRLVRNGDTSQLMFNIYSGNDHTTLQSVLPAVIFAPELDNLSNVSYLTQTGAYKNVAYVVSPDGTAWVYADNTDPSVAGFERKTLFVDANDIKYADRTQLLPAPYVITDSQQASIKIIQQLTTITQEQHDSLQKILNMKRLLTTDLTNITASVATPYAFVGTEVASITAAETVVGITTDQHDGLVAMAAFIRLTSSQLSSLNTLVQNNVTLTAPQKTDITNAANRQSSAPMPTEVTDVNNSVALTNSYNVAEDAALQIVLTQKGKEELAKNTNLAGFDGEISKNSQYIYGRDYQLGDLVEIRDSDQVTNQMRVTEQIFACDDTGDHAYPTLSEKLLITAGSWYAEPSAEVWNDLTDPADTWASRP